MSTFSIPRPARPCRCALPAGDPRDATCLYCGRQVNGRPIPTRHGLFTLPPSRKRRSYRPMP